MGKAGSKLRFWTRPMKYFNIEQRAMKEISKDKMKQAPPYPSMEKIMEQVRKDPNLLKRDQPSKETLANLQKVYLTSKGTNPIIRPKRQQELQEQEPEQKAASKNPSVSRNAATEKKLPKSTEEVKYPYYGFEEPYIIPKGKLSLRQALDLIGKYQQDEEKWNVEVLSEEFKLDVDTTRNIVTHFRAFQIHLPASLNKGEEVGRLGKVKNFVGQQFLPDGKRPEKDKGNVR